MNARIFLIPCICAVLLIALVLPAGADDTIQVTTVPRTDNITVASPAAFDPLGAIESIIGLQHEDRNLTQDINANDQQIHQNWWDNLNIFSSILGNREAVRSDQQHLAGYRADISQNRQDNNAT
jgi:hypothetical protein